MKRPAFPFDAENAFRLTTLQTTTRPFEPSRTNGFSIYWIESGRGQFWSGPAEHDFQPSQLLFFVPYQHIRFAPQTAVHGTVLEFHANFLCVETFHAETGCSGALFNDPYGRPIVEVPRKHRKQTVGLLSQIAHEQATQELAYRDAILASTKLLMILAARWKMSPSPSSATGVEFRHPLLAPLRDLIEQHYCELHAPADYARLLHVTPKTLGRAVREHLGKTPTDLIRERILTHAKWHLLHTLKPVKQVAAELGFQDELYFSRLFKKATGLAPSQFRDLETEIRGGSNLSMLSSDAPIPASSDSTDHQS